MNITTSAQYNAEYCYSDLLTADFLNQYIHKQPNWGFNGLGYMVYKRTYARAISDDIKEEWWQTVARCINGAQKIGALYTKEEAERLFDLVFNLKCNFAGRMLWQLGTSTVDKYGLASLLNCFAYETEIITDQGIKKIGDLAGTTPNLMTRNGKYTQSEVKQFGEQFIWLLNLTKGNSKKTIRTTKSHRWFRRSRRGGDERGSSKNVECLTDDLMPGDKLVSTFGQSIKGDITPSPYGIISGIVFGDGSVCNNVAQVRLCGDKNAQLIKYFVAPKIYNCDGDIIIGNLPKYFKDRPALDMDKSYLYGWLAGYFATDGSIKKNGQIRLSSANEQNLLFVRDVLSKLGIGYSPITQQSRVGIGSTAPSVLYSLNIHGSDLKEDFFLLSSHKARFIDHIYKDQRDWTVESIVETKDREPVYCAVVPDTHDFVLESNILTGNCWYTAMREPEDFCFVFDHLMLGGGVGFSVKREDIHELPRIKKGVNITHEKTKDADFIIPDSRQGWVELYRKTLQAFFKTGKSFTYSSIIVRGAGEPIQGFGGLASGPQILIEGVASICSIFKKREGKKLRSIDVLDINNIIGEIVVSGNVRRSAEIAIGDADDYLYLRAKNWSSGNIPNWRSKSNNSIEADTFEHISNEVWDNGYTIDPKTGVAKGEAYGFINMKLCQKYGRLGEERVDNCDGVNPCAEISLADGEACNLAELYLNNIDSPEELLDCAKLLYKTQKAVWNLPAIYEKTDKIVKKNRRIGLGVTGVCQSLHKLDWLDSCYVALREYDKMWSTQNNIPESIKLTTVKPSGCVVPSTIIKTESGDLSMEDIFKQYGDIELCEKVNEYREWYTAKPFKVYDKNNDLQTVTKLFVNGIEPTIKITFEDDTVFECTPDHKLLLTTGEWKRAKDLTELDELQQLNAFMKIKSLEASNAFTVDIEVENTHCYQLKNGVISHNTLSLLAGATAGGHAGYSRWLIRRVRMSSTDPLIKICRDSGYKTEYAQRFDGTEDYSTIIVEFPCEFSPETVIASQMTAVDQLELVKKLQTIWSDNSVSVTIYYEPEELDSIKQWMSENYETSSKTLSFLLHSKHGFVQAPLEEIDESTYRKLIKRIKPINTILDMGSETFEGLECAGGACPLR